MFSTQLIIDADWTEHGWEIMLRFTPEDMVTGWSGLSDVQLAGIFGSEAALALINERDRKEQS